MYANTAAAQQVVDRMQSYGVVATGEVVTSEYHDQVSYDNQMTLGELVNVHKGRITRVRLLTERWPSGRMADISYIHGTYFKTCETCHGRKTYAGGMGCSSCQSQGGSYVTVPVYVDCVTGLLREVKGDFIEWAKREGVYAKGCGLLDEENWSVLY